MNGNKEYYERLNKVIRAVGMRKGRIVAVRVNGSTRMVHLTFTRSTTRGQHAESNAKPGRASGCMTLDEVLDKVQQAVVEFVRLHDLPFGKFKFIVKDGQVKAIRRIEHLLESEHPAPSQRGPRNSNQIRKRYRKN